MLGAILAAAIAATSPAAIPAPPGTATAQAIASAPPKDPDPLICRSEASSGTRLTHRVCFRKSVLIQRGREDRQDLERLGAARQPDMMGGTMSPMGPPR